MFNPDAAFDTLIAERLPHGNMRPQTDTDIDFLIALFVACSPMAGLLPEPMLLQQAQMANQSFHAAAPEAMRRILQIDGRPVGRLIIDWHHGETAHCIDIALLPEVQKSGLGLCMLQCWIDVANQQQQPCSLEVLITNPALQLYQRLGFAPTPEMDGTQMSLKMERPTD